VLPDDVVREVGQESHPRQLRQAEAHREQQFGGPQRSLLDALRLLGLFCIAFWGVIGYAVSLYLSPLATARR